METKFLSDALCMPFFLIIRNCLKSLFLEEELHTFPYLEMILMIDSLNYKAYNSYLTVLLSC